MLKQLKIWIMALALFGTSAQAATIDVMMLYTQPADDKTWFGINYAINNYISYANRIYSANDVDIKLNLVHKEKYSNDNVTPTSDALSALRNSATVKALRSQHKADMVVLIGKSYRTDGSFTICGRGYVGTPSSGNNAAFNITAIDCGSNTFVHELGHNMGLNHSRKQGNESGGFYTYGKGYGVDYRFTTIMAYPSAFGGAFQLDVLSNPYRSNCLLFMTCGGKHNGEDDAYSVKALNNVAERLAAYF